MKKNNFFWIKEIKRTKLINKNNVQLRTLKEYLEDARNLISHLSKHSHIKQKRATVDMNNNEDVVSYVAHNLMLADMSFDPNKNASLSTYRTLYAYYAVLDIYRISKRKQNRLKFQISDDDSQTKCNKDEIGNREQVQHLLHHSGLKEKERIFIEEYYILGTTRSDISKKHGVSFECVRLTINRALAKMRKHDQKN